MWIFLGLSRAYSKRLSFSIPSMGDDDEGRCFWDPHSSAMPSLPPVPSFHFSSVIFIMASLLSSWSSETAWSLLKGKMRRREHGSWVPVTLEGDRVVEMKDGRAPLCCLSTSSRSCSKFLGSNERNWLYPVSCVYLWVMCNSYSGSWETLGMLQFIYGKILQAAD